MIERKGSDTVMPGDEMQRILQTMGCDTSEGQVQFVAQAANVSAAGVRSAVAGRWLYRREWDLLARELGIIV